MDSTESATTPITTLLPPSLVAELRRVAAEHERSVSAELRFLVRRHVAESAA